MIVEGKMMIKLHQNKVKVLLVRDSILNFPL